MEKIISVTFRNGDSLYIGKVKDYDIQMGYLTVIVEDDSTYIYHIDLSDVSYYVIEKRLNHE